MLRIRPQIMLSSLRIAAECSSAAPTPVVSTRLSPGSSTAVRFFSATNEDSSVPENSGRPASRRVGSSSFLRSSDPSQSNTINEIFRQPPAGAPRQRGQKDGFHRTTTPERNSEGRFPRNNRNDRNQQSNRQGGYGRGGGHQKNGHHKNWRTDGGQNSKDFFERRTDNRTNQSYNNRHKQAGKQPTMQLRNFIDKLRETSRAERKEPPSGSSIAASSQKGSVPIPGFLPIIRRHNKGETQQGMLPRNPNLENNDKNHGGRMTRPPYPQQTRKGPGFRMPFGDALQRQNNNARPRNNRARIRNDMEFLEGRVGSVKEESVQNVQKSSSTEERARVVTLPLGGLDLASTSALFRVKIDDILAKVEDMGMTSKDKEDKDILLDVDVLELLALEFDIETIRGDEEQIMDSQELLMHQRRSTDATAYPTRPPVVCIMGHVDHGKTTLMDALRRKSSEQQGPKTKKKAKSSTSNVAGTEAGGITQIVTAFQVDVEGQDSKVTFLDTPGHAAFKSMRQSGSHAADIIVLVIAADDGVSEQTIEILDFYKSIVKGSDGGISLVVALNKIDKPGIEVIEAQQRIENQLLELGIVCEGMGGESEFGPPVQVVPTSGLSGQGLDELIEGLTLQSEVMDLRASDEAPAEGIVMDARMEKGLGVVADCIIRWGSIQKGDHIVSGTQSARVRMLKDLNNKMLKRGVPSQPVRLVGFKSLPRAGDPIICVESEEIAEEIVEQRLSSADEVQDDRVASTKEVEIHIGGMRKHNTRRVAKFHELAGLDDDDGTIRIPIVVKADADGSLSAVRDSLISLGQKSSHRVVVDPIQEGIGDITPTDIQMAAESNACIFAFGLKRIDQTMINLAESEGVTIQSNDIIYSLLDEAKLTLGRYLPATTFEKSHGKALVQAIFTVDGEDGKEKVAGMKVFEGNLYKSKNAEGIPTNFRVYRNGELVSPQGENVSGHSLRHFKKLVDSVRHGDECGLVLSGFDDFEEGDEVECYSMEMKASTL